MSLVFFVVLDRKKRYIKEHYRNFNGLLWILNDRKVFPRAKKSYITAGDLEKTLGLLCHQTACESAHETAAVTRQIFFSLFFKTNKLIGISGSHVIFYHVLAAFSKSR